jgi:hypothetical protein
MKQPKWEDTFEMDNEVPKWDDTSEVDELEASPEREETSQIIAGLSGIGQGATLGFGDEIGAAIATLPAKAIEMISEQIPGAAANVDKQLREQGFTGSAIESKGIKDTYKDIRDTTRDYQRQLKEDHPLTSLGSEIVGGMGTGFGALGNVAKGAGLGSKVAKGAALGAAQGGVSGAGYSEEDSLAGVAKDTGTGALLGGVIGGAIPVAGATLKSSGQLAKKGTKKIEEIVRSSEIGETFLDAAKYTKSGQSVIGDKAYNDIIKKSKEVIVDELLPIVKDQDTTLGKSIAKIYKKLEKSKGSADFSKELQSTEKQIDNLIKTKKAATPEQIQSLNSLKDLIVDIKQTHIKIAPTKQVKDSVTSALDSLKNKMNKIKANASEVGENISFTKPKIDLDNGTVTVFESTSGKPITEVIKYGKATPIKFVEELKDTPLQVQQLRSIKEGAGQIGKQAKDAGLGIAQKPAFGLAKKADEAVTKVAEAEGLGKALPELNKKFSALAEAKQLLPAKLQSELPEKELNKLAQLFRKGDMEGIGGDSLRDTLDSFFSKLKESGIADTTIKKLQASSEDIAKRYELARSARQTFGLGLLGTGKSAAVFGGALTGGAVREVEKIGAKIANKIPSMSGFDLSKSAQSMTSSSNKGIQALGKQLQFALQQEGPIKNAAIWSLSQQPAFREAIRQSAGEESEDEFSNLMGTEPLNIPASSDMQEDEVSMQDYNPERSPSASEFLVEKETTSNVGYVPKNSSKSGVTIATGLDLGNFDLNKINISKELKDKLIPFVGLRGEDARKVASNLKLSDLEVQEIDGALEKYTGSRVDSLLDGLPSNISVNEEFKDGLQSFYINSSSGAKALIERIKQGKIDEAISKGVEWNKTGGQFAAGLLQRRMEELYKMFPEKSDLIQKEGKLQYDKYKNKTKRTWDELNTLKNIEPQINREPQGAEEPQTVSIEQLQDLQNRLNAHSKYVNSGGNAVYSSTGERLMESVNQLDLPDEVKQEAEDAIVDGDIQKLRTMLDSLKTL